MRSALVRFDDWFTVHGGKIGAVCAGFTAGVFFVLIVIKVAG